ncbi:ankyrin repeat domain-containing protein [Legionella lytica]|uniref:Ankyrin repeat domain-containing protein n=1 Tax=Legionella lytica TaxID=96232 RepID=A0ABY4Y6R1_9GAMM|nr:ankyrin repeat domain-containing protein [Legionella lytica]USQ13320.1 ankyrin repeat domain-containing protein [Legionella lytica]
MAKLTHRDLYRLGKLLDYQLSENGLCHGFTLMLIQAILAEDEQNFFKRLDFIASYNPDFHKLKEDLEKAKEKIQSTQDQPVDEESEKLLEILAFFDGLELYLVPAYHPEFFEQAASQEDIDTIYSLIRPERLKDTELTHLLNKPYACDKQNLKNYLNDLADIFNNMNTSPPILLRNIDHSICLKYNQKNSSWLYVDINDFERDLKNAAYFRNLSSEELSENIFKSFAPEQYPHVVINVEILANKANLILKSALEDWHAKHPITTEQAKMLDHFNTGLLFLACRHGHLNVVQDLLKHPDAMINTKTPKEETPLLIACAKGHLEIVRKLLAHPQTEVNASNLKKQTPLSFACAKKYTGIIQAVLKHPQTLVNEANNEGEAPLHRACQHNDSDTVQALLDHKLIDVNLAVADQGKKTPLYIACGYGHQEIVQKLIDRDDILVDQGEAEGITPLCAASSLGFVEIACILLKKANVNQPSNAGNTPLHYACASLPNSEENKQVIQLLLEHGANLTAQNHTEETAIDVALDMENTTALYILLQFTKEKGLAPGKVMSTDTFEALEDWIQENIPDFINYMRHFNQQEKVSELSFFNHAVDTEVVYDTAYDNSNRAPK